MEKVRVGVIGLGTMGTNHIKYLIKGEVQNAELTAICDIDPERIRQAKGIIGDSIPSYDNADELLASNVVDGVIIATPHYYHPVLAIKALQKGIHVLVEKPAGVYTKQVKEMNEEAEKSNKIFGIMYNQRTNPLYQKLKDLIANGGLGELKRTNWIITNWYRPQSYYDNGGWRATWSGEGGGTLLNQNPHNLDLWQWTCGMPKRVFAFCYNGKFHNIEVEDDVTAFVEYENGATGVYITSTGDAPGTDRLEVTGDRGKIVIEDGKLNFWRLCVSERKFNSEFKGGFGAPECWKCEVPIEGVETKHQGITENWANAILKGTKLLSPGLEGIKGLQISNAIHLSAWTNKWVDIPVNDDLFYEKLQERIRNSQIKK